ncbi:MAG: sulfatase-like hydrolase/transferase [Paracoccaceae bacterium]
MAAKSDAPTAPHWRFSLTPFLLNLCVGIFIMAAHNNTFWSRVGVPFEGHPVKAAIFALMIFAFLMFVISILTPRWLQKPVLVALLLIGAVTSFYQDKLGITIDREMIQNAVVTTAAESKHLITLPFLLHVVVLGVLPGLVVLVVRVRRSRPLRAGLEWVGVVLASFALFAGLLFSDAKLNMGTLRENKEILASQQPMAPLSGAARYAKMMLKSTKIVLAPFGRDAVPGPFLAKADKPVLLVIWAGETTRAENWGLNGYERDTTPELRKRGVVNFSDVTSCGTATATSLPCMFSHLTRSQYSYDGGLSYENLLDVLRTAGFRVEWWDNNTGHKDIAARAEATGFMITDHPLPEACDQGECTDLVYLPFLREKAATITQNTVLVFHQIGSHGPSYYLRYPAAMEGFKPDCSRPELTECSAEELRNAYDNTILYADWVMAQSIDILNGSDRIIPAMFYVSDHGESLGESGLYLHGAPWFMAPEEQIKVPMVIWMADRFQQALGVTAACLDAHKADALSQDNMYSTVLGLLDVTTETRAADLDLTATCRPEGT